MIWICESPLGGNQEVIRSSDGCPGIEAKLSDAYPGIDTGLKISIARAPSVLVLSLVKARIELFPHATAYLILVI